MRQLTSLDAQFLAVESARTYGHVGGLAVYDPATAPGGELEIEDICRLVGERIHLLPPFRWRLVGVPLGLDHPYWVEDPDFDLDFHIRDSAVPPPGDDRQLAETVARIFARPLDRTPAAVGAVPDPGPRGRARRAADEGPPLRRRRRVGQRDPHRAARPQPRGPRDPAARGATGRRARAGRAGDARPRPAGAAAAAAARAALGADRAPEPDRAAGRERVPRRADDLARRGATSAAGSASSTATRRSSRRPPPARRGRRSTAASPATAASRSGSSRSTRSRRSRTRPASPSTTSSSRCARARCATGCKERDELPKEPLVAMVPVSVRTEEQMGTFGNRVSMMIVPIADRRGRPQAPAQAHARAAARRQGAPQGACPRTCSRTRRASSRPPSPRWPRARRWR